MYKYLLFKRNGRDICISYLDLPLCVDHRLQEDEVIEILIVYIRRPDLMQDQLEQMEDGIPYAVLGNGELYDASKYVQIVIDNELY